MHMRLATAFAVFASVEGLRRRAETSQEKPEMREDRGPVLDQDGERQISGPDERFENQIHEAKMSQIWWKVTSVQTPAPIPSAWDAALSSLSMMAFNDFFDYWLEEKPMGQAKVIHMQAAACKFSMKTWRNLFKPAYTGIFAPGTTTGLIRMGPPAPDMERTGLSLKWFRSYVHSGNTVMAAKGGSRNFFEQDNSNHIELFDNAPLLLLRKIAQQTMCSGATGLSDLGRYDQDGKDAGDKLRFPYELVLESANRTLATMPAGRDYKTELWKLLEAIPVGTKVFKVMARPSPGGSLEEIGEIKLASQCKPSSYADTRLAFRHDRMDDDLDLRPEWAAAVREFCDNL